MDDLGVSPFQETSICHHLLPNLGNFEGTEITSKLNPPNSQVGGPPRGISDMFPCHPFFLLNKNLLVGC
jgi:hypothetical protein